MVPKGIASRCCRLTSPTFASLGKPLEGDLPRAGHDVPQVVLHDVEPCRATALALKRFEELGKRGELLDAGPAEAVVDLFVRQKSTKAPQSLHDTHLLLMSRWKRGAGSMPAETCTLCDIGSTRSMSRCSSSSWR